MSLTLDMKKELARARCVKHSEQKAEVTALVRFAGGLTLVKGGIIIESELDSRLAALRLIGYLRSLYGIDPNVILVKAGSIHRYDRYLVRVVEGANHLARQTGLLDRFGRPVRGMPPSVVSGGIGEALAVWRGAFLARGSLTEPGRSCSLEISCPGSEAALALVGAARRLDVAAKSREARGADRVVVRETEAIGRLIELLGAQQTLENWRSLQEKREARGSVNRLANFDDANLRRSARAAVAAAARVSRAFEILGDDIPDHLRAAGQLRLAHRDASLEELGKAANPPLTKDAVAGRIRRLLAAADKRAKELGIADTQSGIGEDLDDPGSSLSAK
ncbi:DNA-binding protein WhiA [Nanchangia anserum]|uniref:Probable cell division protein WhiA n=1 Tax=Nanchangia anserum TaxID=2692125 RepID=A0A8I0KTK6_9ACTO|nr:DNA-binding protein WhiA [Nanchangia anserum]MBD3688718.1 DNA-binding protein WhiA [Nanchangia anserum]QOX82465.1 DNA-binding protein WhiA [Nanchangia anserum]